MKHTILILLFSSCFIYSQNTFNEKHFQKWFDSIVGIENTNIFNGTVYAGAFKSKNEDHQYLLSSYSPLEFSDGNSIIYDDQPHHNLAMKYDVYRDELIVKLIKASFSQMTIQLIKEKIKSFTIDNRLFINVDNLNQKLTSNSGGFHEVIFQSKDIFLLKKHTKRKKEILDYPFVHYEFPNKNFFSIIYKNQYVIIKSKRDLVSLFPNLKEKIHSFYHTNTDLRKNDTNKFMFDLAKYLNLLVNNSDSNI